MHLPQLRRRFVWPADDLVTMNVTIDKGIDRGLWWVPGHRPMVDIRHLDAGNCVSVLGFPRSANSLLTVWLGRVASSGVTVLDGRNSHSALDLHRQTEAGIPVIVPVRRPVDACASMLVRQARFDSTANATRMLRAYIAWHVVASRVLQAPTVVVADFDEVTKDPRYLALAPPFRRVINRQAAAKLDPGTLMQQARDELSQVVGQGLAQDGIPARYLISLPDPGRADELERAKAHLQRPELAKDRARADAIYAQFMAAARSLALDSE